MSKFQNHVTRLCSSWFCVLREKHWGNNDSRTFLCPTCGAILLSDPSRTGKRRSNTEQLQGGSPVRPGVEKHPIHWGASECSAARPCSSKRTCFKSSPRPQVGTWFKPKKAR